jgi:hypothetical protein
MREDAWDWDGANSVLRASSTPLLSMWPCKSISHIQDWFFIPSTSPIKLKPRIAKCRRVWETTHWTKSNQWLLWLALERFCNDHYVT